MKILHYSLGLPPYRSGGLTKYSLDIMKEQEKQGDEVYLLFPGKLLMTNKKTEIKFFGIKESIRIYEIINPLPVPLLDGTLEPMRFMTSCDEDIFMYFLEKMQFDVVHIHTLMGLHKEMLLACKKLGIKVVFTTHDYYGLCTKVNFVDNSGCVCKKRDVIKCLKCNATGFNKKKLYILQSPMYRILKSNKVFSLLKKIKKFKNSIQVPKADIVIDKDKYEKLLKYYEDMFLLVDVFLFNSDVTKNIYEKYLKVKGEVVYITHGDIKDRRKKKKFKKDNLNITFLGPTEGYKGFNLLVLTMEELKKRNINNINLNVYGKINVTSNILPNNIYLNGTYNQDDLENIFSSTDLVIVPSIWYETFGFNTIEALSYGVPVIVSSRVGSRVLIESNFKENIFNPNVEEILRIIIRMFDDKGILQEQNEKICESSFKYYIEDHVKRIKEFY
ncbi:glycosyltransferase [Clostridium cibarium]|uniref:Glycosyltransferase n=1 Tax=Clostridium cibarium TaxID=2762247 RepID=A0ABR8PUC0_9CLOT|nr:glycosyltransferase [Clostridium cibarium]MBD7911780.1 glycosyltransferase [Clostridium cibarium]